MVFSVSSSESCAAGVQLPMELLICDWLKKGMHSIFEEVLCHHWGLLSNCSCHPQASWIWHYWVDVVMWRTTLLSRLSEVLTWCQLQSVCLSFTEDMAQKKMNGLFLCWLWPIKRVSPRISRCPGSRLSHASYASTSPTEPYSLQKQTPCHNQCALKFIGPAQIRLQVECAHGNWARGGELQKSLYYIQHNNQCILEQWT